MTPRDDDRTLSGVPLATPDADDAHATTIVKPGKFTMPAGLPTPVSFFPTSGDGPDTHRSAPAPSPPDAHDVDIAVEYPDNTLRSAAPRSDPEPPQVTQVMNTRGMALPQQSAPTGAPTAQLLDPRAASRPDVLSAPRLSHEAASTEPGSLPGWVLPYLLAALALALAGAFVLWTEARVLGHF